MRIVILCLAAILLQGCNLEVNTTDGQASKTVEESVKRKILKQEYVLKETTDSAIHVEEAWIENIWYNAIAAGDVTMSADSNCQFCFRLTAAGASAIERRGNNWVMKSALTNNYVGKSGIYSFTLPNCSAADEYKVYLFDKHRVISDTAYFVFKKK